MRRVSPQAAAIRNTTVEDGQGLQYIGCSLANFYILQSDPDSTLFLSMIVVVAVNCLLACTGIILNASVIAAYTTNKRLRAPSNMLLFVLACSDMLVSAVAQPTFIAKKLVVLASRFSCFLWTFNRLLFYGTGGLSLCIVSILSIERLVTLRYPYTYQTMITRTRLKVAIVLSVLVILLIFTSQALRPAYEILAVVGATVIFLNVALVVSIWVWIQRLIHRHASSIKSMHTSVSGDSHSQSDQVNNNRPNTATNSRSPGVLRSTRTCYLIVGGVLLCYSPIFIGHVYSSVRPSDFDFFYYVVPWMDTLALGNSVLNPAILLQRKRNFRKTVKGFFGVTNENTNPSPSE